MGYFGNFLGLGCILVIFRFLGYFGYFLSFTSIFLILRFRGYFGHFGYFLSFRGISVIFKKFIFSIVYLNFKWVLVGISGFIH